ncbi:hypothetical protein Tmar_0415 [Thermaerobacter marianensis DSM 12885]|uniref:Anti-sigma-W factor RsiW n=1 Tax=Thermaerobacter marianensis (strain ATCC 700841 / DSM 12885 / JCM 10246 / 7p75a) TaxID=644966 RepID=E6SGJ0_THEM7|nr:DUF4349 domain-containing protein [Thermaerobacter marianensis]ADU50536.1 hypothetical protein Tmar_0415 [Thermaerobacter marianensis DSM 12885]
MIGGFGHVDRWLSDWLDGTLPGPRRQAVEGHLAACARCRARAEAMRETVRQLRSLTPVPPPPDLVARVRARLAQDAATAPGAAGPSHARGAVPGPAPEGPATDRPVATAAGADRPAEEATRRPMARLWRWVQRRPGWRPAMAGGALVVLLVWAAGRWLGGTGGAVRQAVAPELASVPETAARAGGWDAAQENGSGAGANAAGAAPDTAPGATAGAAEALGSQASSAMRPAAASGRLLIRTGRLDLVVPDVAAAYREAEAIARRYGGFVQDARLDRTGAVEAASLTLRVPDQRLETVMDELAALAQRGRVAGHSIEAQDISSQYIDVKARLETLQAQEARLRQLASRSAGIDELLRVEQELWRVRGEIEQLEGQVRFWDQAVQLATIEVGLRAVEATPPEPAGSLRERAARAFLRSLHGLGQLVQAAIVGLAALVPYLAVVGAAAGAWLGWRRRHSRP